jgi:hypothetical protein
MFNNIKLGFRFMQVDFNKNEVPALCRLPRANYHARTTQLFNPEPTATADRHDFATQQFSGRPLRRSSQTTRCARNLRVMPDKSMPLPSVERLLKREVVGDNTSAVAVGSGLNEDFAKTNKRFSRRSRPAKARANA